MGRQSKKPASDAFYNMSRMMVPRDLLEFFEVSDIKEQASEWDVILEEKVSLVPVALAGVEDAVLDGFCNPIRLMSHCFSIKPIYLVIKRRRWKRSCTNEHFSNEYTIAETSAKLTPDMAGFLKR